MQTLPILPEVHQLALDEQLARSVVAHLSCKGDEQCAELLRVCWSMFF